VPFVIPEPGALVSLIFVAALYVRGVRALWARAGRGRGVRVWQAAAFGGGLLAVLVALETPLDRLSEALFSAHMVQHLVLMLVAAPLLALGSPRLALAWSLPATRLWRLIPGRPSVAFALHVVALWAWHVPSLYDAALANGAVHAAEHASFLATGVLFWWALLPAPGPRLARLAAPGTEPSTSVHVSARRGEHAGYGLGVLYVFGMALQSTVLGALLTFTRAPWYTSHLGSTAAWGLTALEDQQLAGVIMWVPGGLIYLVAALALFGRWLSAGAAPAPGPSTPARRSAGQLASREP
jgi:putative membrane protein